MHKKKVTQGGLPLSGFTIVELLIIIVVIAILASLAVVSYNGIQRRALNTVRIAELKDFEKILHMYKTLNGDYPGGGGDVVRYCVGTGFPIGYGGEARCRESFSSDPLYSYRQSDGAGIMAQFATVGVVSGGLKKPVNGWLVGPWMEAYPPTATPPFNYNEIRISTAIESSDPADCSKAGFLSTWIDGTTQICTTYVSGAWAW